MQAEKKPAKRGKGMEGERKSFVVPLLGYPGLQLTKTTVLQVLTDGNAHFETICALVDKFKPDAIFYIMDLTVEAEDTVALRATLNAYLHWIQSTLSVIEVLEHQKVS